MMLALLILSTVMSMTSNSWLVVWAMLEINTISMCFMMCKEMKNKSNTFSLKYFVIQTLTSSVIMLSSMFLVKDISKITMTLAVMMKIGAWPSHNWYMNMFQSMSMKMKSMMLMMTWQKIIPIYLIYIVSLESEMSVWVLMMSTIMCSTLPLSLANLNTSPLSILVISSIYNNSWFFMALICSLKIFFLLMMIYCLSLAMFISMMSMASKKTNLNKMNPLWGLMINMNMSGMPPFSMFWVKLSVLSSSVDKGIMSGLLILLLLMACLMTFMYTKLNLNLMAVTPKKNQMSKKEKKSLAMIIVLSMLSGVMVF